MASASLPFLFLAVQVDGEAYCDARLHLIESEEEMPFVLEESLKPAHLAEDFERSHLE
jgi:hypothetical protein